MPVPLLKTRLFVPRPRPDLIPRPRLIERLNQGLRGKLTLISAPAGFGKTTLLSAWIHQALQRPVAWLSLDENDHDPVRFLAYLTAALQEIDPELGQQTGAETHTIDAHLTALINEITLYQHALVLVLDDYHLVSAQAIHDQVNFMLTHRPDNLHLVIATRADPPLPIARLRGRGELLELRQADLRFTADEVSAYLNQTMKLQLPADAISALENRTEGWIAGLQMAAASMQGRSDATDFVAAFTGSNRHILDYLIEEVLQRQPKEIQTFLQRTAILNRLTGPLCDQLLANGAPVSAESSTAILERLERNNLFVVPLDDRREWYRYHHLFADLLRKRLQQESPTLVPELHGRASKWHEQHNFVGAAIEHALLAGDHPRAAELTELAAEETVMRSELATLLGWVESLPAGLVRERPTLTTYHAWALLLSGRPVSDMDLQSADGQQSPAGQAARQAFAAIYRGDIKQARAAAQQTLTAASPDDLFLQGIADWVLSIAELAKGDLAAGTQALAKVARQVEAIGNRMIAVPVLCQQAKVAMRQGQLNQAREIYHRALALATDEKGRQLPIAGEPLMGLGDLEREQNDLDSAERHLNEGIALTTRWSETATLDGYLPLARIKQAQGETQAANLILEQARQLALRSETTELDDLVVALQKARLMIVQGELDSALRWARELGLFSVTAPLDAPQSDDSISQHLRKYEQMVLVRLALAQNQPQRALALLADLQITIERLGRFDLALEHRILTALAWQARGDDLQAREALAGALAQAEPGNYVRLFIDEGRPMVRLLRAFIADEPGHSYARQLLAALSPTTDQVTTPPLPQSEMLVEQLSAREQQVLQLLATDLTIPEIAAELVVATSTVRSHVKSIYAKLDVHSRFQAIARAQELGLL